MIIDWFRHGWMYAGLVAGLVLLALVPVLAGMVSLPLLAVYVQLPAYMLHQVEEHHRDRFRLWFNRVMAGRREALSTSAVVFINVVGVWAVDLLALYLARFAGIGWGLVAVYLTLVNAVVHITGAAVQRRYNPGLFTAVALFLPLGFWALREISSAPGVTATDHAVALAVVIALHAAIIVHVKRRVAALAKAGA